MTGALSGQRFAGIHVIQSDGPFRRRGISIERAGAIDITHFKKASQPEGCCLRPFLMHPNEAIQARRRCDQ